MFKFSGTDISRKRCNIKLFGISARNKVLSNMSDSYQKVVGGKLSLKNGLSLKKAMKKKKKKKRKRDHITIVQMPL